MVEGHILHLFLSLSLNIVPTYLQADRKDQLKAVNAGARGSRLVALGRCNATIAD